MKHRNFSWIWKIQIFVILGFLIYFGILFYPKTICGEIIDIKNSNFSIITGNDLIYSFNKNYNFDFTVGQNISIKFVRPLSNFTEIQNVDILNIKTIEQQSFETNDLFYEYYDSAIKYIDSLTLEEKVGQFLLARVPENNSIETIKKYNIGGYVLFDRDISKKTKDELIYLIKNYQDASNTPLLIAIDEEGGSVSRISNNRNLVEKSFLSPQDLYKVNGFESIKEDTIYKTKLLEKLGINMNLAPVADVSLDSNSFIYDRSFGMDADETAKYIETVIANSSNNVSYTLKHFPGYGDNLDTHIGISIDERVYTEFLKKDFLPFKAGIDNGAQAVMMSHNIVKSMDDNYPSSLSVNVHNILRDHLKFSGVILTDDLSMGAIKNFSDESPYVRSLLCGNNLLIVSDIDTAYNDILSAVINNNISEQLINRLLIKSIAFKYYKNLMH